MESIVLSKKQFSDLKNLVYSTSGINLHSGKLELLKSKIAKRMRVTRKGLNQYLDDLRTNEREIIEFIDTVTTNHSFFFRENKSISSIVAGFASRPDRDTKTFRIWCAACSTGDEPYSMAVQLKNMGLKFTILATDISHSVLATARRAIYKTDKIKHVPMPIVHQYFQKGSGKYAGHVRVKKEVIQHIQFSRFNLISDPIPNDKFDAVLCRNVMIYFDQKITEYVVNKLFQTLVPGGFFAIGNAESLMNLNHGYKTVPGVPSLYSR